MPALPPPTINQKPNKDYYALKGIKWMNQSEIIKSLRAMNYRIAHAHMMQCYSAYVGTVKYTNKNTGKEITKPFDWEAAWKSAAICFSGFYGNNIAGLDDHGWLIFPWNW